MVECLFHAARISPNLSAENAQALLVLSGRSAEAMKKLDDVATDDMPTGYGAILAAAGMFTPIQSGGKRRQTEPKLAKATSTTVNSPNAPPLFSFVRFAWGVLALDLGLPEAEDSIRESLKNDAVEAIDLVLKTGVFQDDHLAMPKPEPGVRAHDTFEIFASQSPQNNPAQDADGRYGCEATLCRKWAHGGDRPREAAGGRICSALAEIYSQEANLALKCGGLKSFLEIASDSEHSVGSLVKLLELCTTIAQRSEGARHIFELLQRSQGAANWDRFLGALIGYVQRFMSSPDDLIDAGEEYDPRQGDPEMNEADAEGLRAYLSVFSAVMKNAERSESAHWLMWLEHRIGAALMDALLQLYTDPVPLSLKSSLLDAIGALCWDVNTAA